jgi:hypothetical protein
MSRSDAGKRMIVDMVASIVKLRGASDSRFSADVQPETEQAMARCARCQFVAKHDWL